MRENRDCQYTHYVCARPVFLGRMTHYCVSWYMYIWMLYAKEFAYNIVLLHSTSMHTRLGVSMQSACSYMHCSVQGRSGGWQVSRLECICLWNGQERKGGGAPYMLTEHCQKPIGVAMQVQVLNPPFSTDIHSIILWVHLKWDDSKYCTKLCKYPL